MTGGSKQLDGYLRELHLPTVREHLEEVARKAQQEELSYEQFLLELVELESQVRRENRIHRRMRQSKLPPGKDLASFELKRIPAKVRRQVKTLLDGSFLDRKEQQESLPCLSPVCVRKVVLGRSSTHLLQESDLP